MADSAATPKYERLVRGVRRYDSPFVAPVYRLWLGADHILQVRDSGYSESYKRFYFRDIQAIVVTRTSRFQTMLVLQAAALVFWALMGYFSETHWGWDGAGAVVFGASGLATFVLLILNLLRGPTCRCVVYTGVHEEVLGALSRIRKTRAVLARLQLLIEGVQGALAPESILEKMSAGFSGSTRKPGAPSTRVSGPLRHDTGASHTMLFALIVLWACMSGVSLFVHSLAVDAVKMPIFLAAVVLCITVIVKQRGSDVEARLGRLVWGLLAALVVDFLAGFVISTAFSFTSGKNSLDLLDPAMHLALTSSGVYQACQTISCIVFTIIGALGMLALRDFRRVPAPIEVPET